MDVTVLDTNFRSVAIVDFYESLIWTDRYCGPGDFEIYTGADRYALSVLKSGYYLYRRDSEHVMIIESIRKKTDSDGVKQLIVTGRSLESILERRIVWAQTILSGNFQNGVKTLINENIISPIVSNRAIPNFIFEDSTDTAITSLTCNAQFTGDNLLDAITSLCESFNVGFKVTLNSSNQFVFKLYSGIDRSYIQSDRAYVIFSPNFENLVSSDYSENDSSSKNVTLVAGEGEGASRRTLSVVLTSEEKSGLDRRELFTDARDISSDTDDGTLSDEDYNELLRQRGKEKLAEYVVTKSFDAKIESSQMYVYGSDYNIGDIVQIIDDYGTEQRSRVVEFITSDSTSGYEEYPTFDVVSISTLAITQQPSDYAGPLNSTAYFAVVATGDDLTYQWQYKVPTVPSWTNLSSPAIGYNTANLQVTATSVANGYLYRCVVTDAYGSLVITDAASLTIDDPTLSLVGIGKVGYMVI